MASFLILLPLWLTGAVDPTLSARWQQVREAYGGASLDRLERLMTVKRVTGSLEATVTTWYDGERSEQVSRTPISDMRHVQDRTTVWVEDFLGYARRLEPRERNALLTIQAVMTFPWFLAHHTTLSSVTTPPMEETFASDLALSLAGGDLALIALNPTSHLIDRAVIPH